MNQNRILVLATAAAAVALAVFLWRPDGGGHESVAANPLERVGQIPPAATAAATRQSVTVRASAPKLESMNLLSELSETAFSATQGRGQLLMELNLAIQLCTNVRFRQEHPSKWDLQQRAKGRKDFSIEASRRFCDYQPATLDVVSKEMLALGTDDEVAQAIGLRALAIDQPTEDAVPLAERLVSTARDPVAVESAAFVLFDLDRDMPQTKAVPIPASLKYREAQIDAQRLAIEMHTCNVRGGCGTGGLYTLLRCHKCGPQVHSLMDMWSQEYPPEVVAYARTLSNYMAANR